MPAPYVRETQRGGLWCVMFKDAYPSTGGPRDEINCGIVAAFTSEARAQEYANIQRDHIRYLEEVMGLPPDTKNPRS